MKKSLQKTFSAYPRTFWVLMTGVFIDQLGANFIYPFFALFVTAHFGVGLAQVGLMLGTMTAGGLLGEFVGGSLADRMGRKVMILFGLLVSGLFSTAIIFITRFEKLFLVPAFGFSVSLPNLVTPTLAGLVIDYYDPNWIWYMCGIIGTITILCYIGLHFRTKTRMDRAVVNQEAA